MNNLYYKIWADAIIYEKTKHGHFRNWKIYTILPMSVLQGLNLFTIFFYLLFFNIKLDIFIEFDFMPGTMTEKALSSFITLFLPFIIINYFLIFRNKRYEKVLEQNKYRNGKLIITYAIVSPLLILLPIIIGKLLLHFHLL